MIVYHGSDQIVKKPIFGYGKASNDYGSGFYLTEDVEKANAWAVANGMEETAYCNKYELPLEDLSVLYLDEHGVLSWIAEVLANRGLKEKRLEYETSYIIQYYKIDTTPYDVIVGYRADDSYMDVVTSFLFGELSADEVDALFRKGNLGHQVCLKSERAFSAIQFLEATPVEERDEYKNYDIQARREAINFISKRRDSIKREKFRPSGITVEYATDVKLTYDRQNRFYYDETSLAQAVMPEPMRKRHL